jgi:hypothetical protein
MTTEIESTIQRFRDGELTLDQLADLFAAHQFRPQTGVPEGSETAYVDLIEKIGTPPEEGTWEELDMASLARAPDRRRIPRDPAASPGPSPMTARP